MTKQNNIWLFGNGLSLDFNYTPPKTGPGPIHSLEGSASVCDHEGALLFATDGMKLWDGQGEPVPGMVATGHSSGTSAAMIVPKPDAPGRYYILTCGEISGIRGFWTAQGSIDPDAPVTFEGPTTGIHLSEVEVEADRSVRVISSGQPLAGFDPGQLTEKLCVIAKDNCRDYWLITAFEEQLYVFSVEANGISLRATHAAAARVTGPGYIKASPDGRHLAVASYELEGQPQSRSVWVYAFDMDTGALSNAREVELPSGAKHGHPYGLAFSANSEWLYYSLSHRKLAKGTIHQARIDSPDTPIPAVEIGELPQNMNGKAGVPHTKFATGALLMGPDGILYAARPGSRFLAAIRQPDLAHPACEFVADEVEFGEGELMFWGLPTLVEFRECESQPIAPSKPSAGGCKPCETEHCVTVSWSAGTRACITISTVECDPCAGRPEVEVKPCPCKEEVEEDAGE